MAFGVLCFMSIYVVSIKSTLWEVIQLPQAVTKDNPEMPIIRLIVENYGDIHNKIHRVLYKLPL